MRYIQGMRVSMLLVACFLLSAGLLVAAPPETTSADNRALLGSWRMDLTGMESATFTFLDNGQGTIETTKWGAERMTWTASGSVVFLVTVDGPADLLLDRLDADTYSVVVRAKDARGVWHEADGTMSR